MTSHRLPVALTLAAGVAAFASAASAQQVDVSGSVVVQTPGPPPPPPGGSIIVQTPAPPPQTVYVQPQPQPVYAQPVYGQPGYVQPGYAQPVYGQPGYPPGMYGPPVIEDRPRLRFGVELGLGYSLIGGDIGAATGFAIDGAARIGIQINNPFAVYYQTGLWLGVVGGVATDGTQVGGLAVMWSNAVLFEYTYAGLLHLGIGPSVDDILGGACATDATGSTTECIGAAGWAFGGDARVALTLGPRRMGRRAGFSLGLDLHPTFANGVFFFGTVNAGYEMY
jgi:hypothetical protein